MRFDTKIITMILRLLDAITLLKIRYTIFLILIAYPMRTANFELFLVFSLYIRESPLQTVNIIK
jgi:hypothetical protein